MLILWKNGWTAHQGDCKCPIDYPKEGKYFCIECNEQTIKPNEKAIMITDDSLCAFIKKIYAN